MFSILPSWFVTPKSSMVRFNYELTTSFCSITNFALVRLFLHIMWNSGLNNFFVKLKHIDKNENWFDNFFRQIKAWKKPRWSDIFFVKSKLTNKRFPFFMNLKILFFFVKSKCFEKGKVGNTVVLDSNIYLRWCVEFWLDNKTKQHLSCSNEYLNNLA